MNEEILNTKTLQSLMYKLYKNDWVDHLKKSIIIK